MRRAKPALLLRHTRRPDWQVDKHWQSSHPLHDQLPGRLDIQHSSMVCFLSACADLESSPASAKKE
jgi:hypothetical protein